MLNQVFTLDKLPGHYLRCTWVYPEAAERPQDAICGTFEMYHKDGTADEMTGRYNSTVTRSCSLGGESLPDMELILDHPELIPYCK